MRGSNALSFAYCTKNCLNAPTSCLTSLYELEERREGKRGREKGREGERTYTVDEIGAY